MNCQFLLQFFEVFFLTFNADPSVLDGYGSQRLVCVCWGCLPAGRLLEFALWPVGGVVGSAHRARLCGCAAVHLTKVGVGGGEGLEQQSSRTVSALNLKDCVKKPIIIWNFALPKCTVKCSSDYLQNTPHFLLPSAPSGGSCQESPAVVLKNVWFCQQ